MAEVAKAPASIGSEARQIEAGGEGVMSVAAGIVSAFANLGAYRSAAHEIEHLMSQSDARLAAKGMAREDVVRSVWVKRSLG